MPAGGFESTKSVERRDASSHVRFPNIECSNISIFTLHCMVFLYFQASALIKNEHGKLGVTLLRQWRSFAPDLDISITWRVSMTNRFNDGSAGDANYGVIGTNYTNYRQPDPHIAAFIHAALGDAKTVLNVGAGAGSYEPVDRQMTAVEPSDAMRRQRPAHLVTAVDATAESLPFADATFGASMATFTVHQWSDLKAGLFEMRRVTRGPVVVLSCDPLELERSWLHIYAPEMIAVEASRYPSLAAITEALGGHIDVKAVPIPLDCIDGFGEGYYGRPERLLDPGARLANSAWSFVDPSIGARFVAELGRDLEDGIWDRRFGHLRAQPFFEGSLRLIVSTP
jgi:hypothetical protein